MISFTYLGNFYSLWSFDRIITLRGPVVFNPYSWFLFWKLTLPLLKTHLLLFIFKSFPLEGTGSLLGLFSPLVRLKSIAFNLLIQILFYLKSLSDYIGLPFWLLSLFFEFYQLFLQLYYSHLNILRLLIQIFFLILKFNLFKS